MTIKMKQQTLSFLFIFVFLVSSFTSCLNNDYDLNNDTIDKNIVLSPGGINLPYGSVEKIFIYQKLNYDGIQVAPDGSLYVEYAGDFYPDQFKIPNFNIGNIDQVTTDPVPLEFPQGVPTTFDFSSDVNVPLLEGEMINYQVTEPVFDNTDWAIDPDQIFFDSFTVNLSFFIQGFSKLAGSAKLNLYITLPDDFEVVGENLDAQRRIVRTLDFNDGNGINEYNPPVGINVKSYKYPAGGHSTLRVDMDLSDIDGLKVEVNNPMFWMSFTTDNKNIVVNSIKGNIKGKQLINGEISGLEDLKNSFGEDAKLQFANPSLYLSVNTNAGADFRLDIDAIDANNGPSLTMNGANGLMFTKPAVANTQKTTSYFIAPDPSSGAPAGAIGKILNLDQLFTTIPDKIDYNFSMNVNEPDATISNTGTVLEGNYKFTLPFDFEDLKVNIQVPPVNLGENLYDNFLQYVNSKITIQADTVIIAAEKMSQMQITATIKFLDENQQTIENTPAKSVSLVQGMNINKFVVDFSKQDLSLLQNARYLNMEFTVEGKGTLTENDYIDIRGLRFVSDGGIHYELNL